VKAYLQMLNDLYSGIIEPNDPSDLERARWAAIEKIAENNIKASFYAKDSAISSWQRMMMLCRLASIVIKTTVKLVFPFIERRNVRWHYGKVIRPPRD
jgi:hypothetical protein